MLFQVKLTIPANTPINNPVRETITMLPGVISAVKVGFPPGCTALAHIRILHKEVQIVPLPSGQWLAWDNFIYEWSEHYQLEETPYSLILEGYNNDYLYSHTITCAFVLDNQAGVWNSDILAMLFGGVGVGG